MILGGYIGYPIYPSVSTPVAATSKFDWQTHSSYSPPSTLFGCASANMAKTSAR